MAELEAFFSRPVAPTRRIAVGELRLAGGGAPDAAAMLLGGIVATFGRPLDDDDLADLVRLIGDVEAGRRTPQPRLRHRFQVDRVGLKRSSTKLVADSNGYFDLLIDRSNGTSIQHALAAVYAASRLHRDERRGAAAAMRAGLAWRGEVGPELLGMLRPGVVPSAMGAAVGSADPVSWAMRVLGLATVDDRPGRSTVQKAFRAALRDVHPDHGAPLDGAAVRIEELDTARRILLG